MFNILCYLHHPLIAGPFAPPPSPISKKDEFRAKHLSHPFLFPLLKQEKAQFPLPFSPPLSNSETVIGNNHLL